ncbi:unnamed protein product [Phyllotreta striolata]|uniref:Poly [ADP-ribose] polymerase n=1 Tax=Phyllotreta striolata TaxID=444603 RepID=A0A9P0GP06_PHYSR|nr:unnamed protein product [Phyllotreta striolata]
MSTTKTTELPYFAEYAKSGRASCKGCRAPIAQSTLRIAVMVQSPHFDGKNPNWHHFDCFFNKQRPKSTDEIDHFESLRLEDQDKIKAKVGVAAIAIVPDKKGKKRANDSSVKLKKEALKDFRIEYAKSGRAMCRGCEQKILKDEVRISKKDFDTDIGKKYGGQDMWHHVACFAQVRSDLAFYESGTKLPGYDTLKKPDQDEVKKLVVPIKQEAVPEKKLKTEDEVDGIDENEYRKQNKIMFEYRDELAKIPHKDLLILLEYNKQEVPTGKDTILDLLADIMTFGTLLPCPSCKGQLSFMNGGYICTGDLTEWTKCQKMFKEPERKAFKVSSELKKNYPFLKKYKYEKRTRIVKTKAPLKTQPVKKEEDAEPRVKREAPLLSDMQFVILGRPPKGKDQIKKIIQSYGGKVVTKIESRTMAVISTEEEVEKMNNRMQEAETEQIHVVSDDFLDEVKDFAGKIPDLIIKKSICDWGSDPTSRLPEKPSSSLKSKSRSIYTKSVPDKVKLKLKGGLAVDPDSELDHIAHVYQRDDKWSAVLGLTDIQSGKNSYYKMQLLESDSCNQYWLFRSWGRIGTTIGGNKTELKGSCQQAKADFRALYEEKTGNQWENRHDFQKIPGRMYPIDVDYGDDKVNLEIVKSESSLPKPVQDLVTMIFDVNSMKQLMAEFELDTEKMPLGKLSKKQIQKAFGVLTELQTLISDKSEERSLFIDASNRFYTFIPHSFGIEDPPILDNTEVIKTKVEMLENLMELEVAYNLMKSSGSDHTVDSYYKQLKTEIDILPHDSEEFNIIKEFVKNTHAATHDQFDLVVEDVFTVRRQGEEKRFKPFRKLHNRKLLWHGSRVTNYAGILSQGLRIAPPEAPVTGYMFGKGIYFADMVSKSANYCCTNSRSPKGLMLLCDVALGNMYEKLHAEMIEKLPKGKHSCLGLGKTQPDPSAVKKIEDIEVPLGKGVPNPAAKKSSLLYNEYIVYDVAQVNIKYLIKMHFEYKYGF